MLSTMGTSHLPLPATPNSSNVAESWETLREGEGSGRSEATSADSSFTACRDQAPGNGGYQ